MLKFLLDAASDAADGGTTPTTNNGGMDIWGTLIMLAIMGVVFYFVAIRPGKKQRKQEEEMRNSLQVGDEITTIGGIIGKIVSIKGETFVLETTKDKTKIRFLKGAIRSVDVKAADLAAQVMEANNAKAEDTADTANAPAEVVDAPAEAPAEDSSDKKKSRKKK